MTRDELAAFDEAVLAEAADEHGVSADRLADLVRTHQSNVRDLPGVEDIVYEWRNYFHRDPLVGRTEERTTWRCPTTSGRSSRRTWISRARNGRRSSRSTTGRPAPRTPTPASTRLASAPTKLSS
ncbi:hypothetical protein ACFQL4_12360 [Halosimplex aquaticum]